MLAPESFVAREFAAPVKDFNAQTLLGWARGVADNASSNDVLRHKEGRRTLRFTHKDQQYFLKLHEGIGWREVFKNLAGGKRPVCDAQNEFLGVNALQEAGVDTLNVVAYARDGWNPATRRSMIVSEDLAHTISLEQYCASWNETPPAPGVRSKLVVRLAAIARAMHDAGVHHRDFYLCHLHMDPGASEEQACHVIDLHRARIRKPLPLRWRLKDLSALYFSALDCGLSRTDLLRFKRCYCAGDLRAAHSGDAFWRRVERRAYKLYEKEFGRLPGRAAHITANNAPDKGAAACG